MTAILPDFKEEPLSDDVRDKLSAFFSEVSKLKEQYREHHSNETAFMSQCQELQQKINVIHKERTELSDNSENVSIQIESITNTISSTEIQSKELKRTLKTKKEALHKKRIENDNLLVNLENITNELEMEREETTKALEKKIDSLFNAKNQGISKLNEIRMISSELYSSVQEIEHEKNEIVKCVANLNEEIEQTNLEIVNKKKTYKNLELQIKNGENDLETLANESKLKREIFNTSNTQLSVAKNHVKEASNLVTEHNIKLDSSQQCLECLKAELKMLNDDNISMKDSTEQQRQAIEGLNDEIDKKMEIKTVLNKKINLLTQSINKIGKESYAWQTKKEDWYKKCADIKKEIKTMENKITVFNKEFDASQREKELIQSYNANKAKSIQNIEIMVFTAESTIKSFENEISHNQAMLKKLKKCIEETHCDLKKNKYELFVKQNKLKKLELKYRKIEGEEQESNVKIIANENLLKQQSNLIEAVRVDKNVYNKSLIDQKEEMKIFKRNFTALNHSINQIKMELSEKDQIYISQHFNVDKIDKNILIIRGKIANVNKKIVQSTHYIDKALKVKMRELNALILKSENILKSQKQQTESVKSETKNLSNNLIQKNSDLSAIKEEIKLLNCQFMHGNNEYNEKCKLLIKAQESKDNLSANLLVIENNLSEIEILKSQISSMENDLLSESLKVESLKNELERPVNIHRWRQLKDTNPEIFRLIQESHKLTKQLLFQNNVIYGKQQNIENKEKLYVNLRKILARQPGTEAREQLNIYMTTLSEKKSKLKLLINQLNIYKNKAHLLKYEINNLNKDKHALKLQYFQMKQREYSASVSALQSRKQLAKTSKCEEDSKEENICEPQQEIEIDNKTKE